MRFVKPTITAAAVAVMGGPYTCVWELDVATISLPNVHSQPVPKAVLCPL